MITLNQQLDLTFGGEVSYRLVNVEVLDDGDYPEILCHSEIPVMGVEELFVPLAF